MIKFSQRNKAGKKFLKVSINQKPRCGRIKFTDIVYTSCIFHKNLYFVVSIKLWIQKAIYIYLYIVFAKYTLTLTSALF